MQTTEIDSINQTVEQTRGWLDELVAAGPFENQQQAYSAFRAVLHAVRDNLNVDEVTDLGSQLPMLVRGFYFEGWRPAEAPNVERDRAAFLEHVRSSLGPATETGLDLEASIRAVMTFLEERISDGQARHVREHLSDEVTSIWAA